MNIFNAIRIATEFLKRAEGYKPAPYQDQTGKWTNGFGNTRLNQNQHVSYDQALSDLDANIKYFNTLISKKLNPNHLLKLQDHQYAAILSFAFNCGVGNWRIWKLLDTEQFNLIPEELKRFDHGKVNGKLVEIKGLRNRREAEIALWKTQDLPTQPIPTPRTEVQPKPNLAKAQNANQAVARTSIVASVAPVAVVVKQYPQFLLPVIVGLAMLLVLLMFYMLYRILKAVTLQKGQVMSDAFNKAFADYQAAINAQQIASEKVIQDKLDAANIDIASLIQQLADNDAADIKVVTDATAAIAPVVQPDTSGQ